MEPTPSHQPDPFSLEDDKYLRSILDRAGFADVVCEAVDYALALGADLDSATDFVINSGSAAGVLASVNDEQRTHVRQIIRQAVAQHQNSMGVALQAATWIVSAANPGPQGLVEVGEQVADSARELDEPPRLRVKELEDSR